MSAIISNFSNFFGTLFASKPKPLLYKTIVPVSGKHTITIRVFVYAQSEVSGWDGIPLVVDDDWNFIYDKVDDFTLIEKPVSAQ